MNPIRCGAYIIVLSIDGVKTKLNHFFKSLDFNKRIEAEQERRHREYEEYCRKYIEAVEKSRSEG